MNIVILEPYFTGSHASWANEYKTYSRHQVTIVSLNGQYWKWRMHGGAVTLAGKFLSGTVHADVLLATDMLDLTTFLALTRQVSASTKTALYFHENQLTYPWSPNDRDIMKQRDMHYGFINYSSALAADAVLFYSHYHLNSFLRKLPRFLKSFPDNNELMTVEQIRQKSSVLHLGMDLKKFDSPGAQHKKRSGNDPPLILWNHRWEYDKNPEEFFALLYRLDREGYDFEVAVLGECFAQKPEIFLDAREKLKDKIVHFGYVDNFDDYAAWLWEADILPVTSKHDFFGMSVVEAVYCGCWPLLPRRLSYPEIFPPDIYEDLYYDDADELIKKMAKAFQGTDHIQQGDLKQRVEVFSWKTMVCHYDQAIESLT